MRSTIALIALTLAGFSTVGCVRETVSCADNPSSVCPEDTGPAEDTGPRADANVDAPGLDAFAPDAGRDALVPDANCNCEDGQVCVAGGTCGCLTDAQCSGGTPLCNTATNECVACLSNTDCTDASAPICDVTDNTCVGCLEATTCAGNLDACVDRSCVQCDDRADCSDDSGMPACVGNMCRQCDANSDCPSTTASRCTATNTCAACMMDSECSHLAATPACNESTGTCVPCMPDNETLCGANSCNPTTNTCTGTLRGMTGACLGCVADSECISGYTCAAVNPALGNSGNYCLPIRVAAGDECPRSYFGAVDGATTDLGATINYCRPATTTCQATLHFRTQQSVMDGATNYRCGNLLFGTSNEACGVVGVNDGLCRTTGASNRCTIPCGSDDDCPDVVGITCLVGPSPRYCSI